MIPGARPWHHRPKRAVLVDPHEYASELAGAIADAMSPVALTAVGNDLWRGPRAGLGRVASALLEPPRFEVRLWCRGASAIVLPDGDPVRVIDQTHGGMLVAGVEGVGTFHLRLFPPPATTLLSVLAIEVRENPYQHSDGRIRDLGPARAVRVLRDPWPVPRPLHITVDVGAGAGVPHA